MNRATLMLGATTLVFGSASAYLYNDLRETRTESAALQARLADLERTSGQRARPTLDARRDLPPNPFGPVSPSDIRPAERSRPAPPPPMNPAAEPVAALVNFGPTMATTDGRDGRDRQRKLLQDPEYRDAMKQQQRLMLPRMYPDLQTALHLDEQQTDALLDVLAEQQISNMTNRPPISPGGERPDENAMREWRAQQQRQQSDREAAIATVLGDAKAQEWKNYQGSMQARSQVRELRSTLEGAGMPLQAEQVERLVAAVNVEQQKSASDLQNNRSVFGPVSNNPDRTAMFERQIEITKQQQQRVRSASSAYLSSAQMRYLERMQTSQLEMQEANLKMMRVQAEAEARGDLPPSNRSARGSFVGR